MTRRGLFNPFPIQVDGGINPKTARESIKAGANHLVAGTYVFEAANMREAISSLNLKDEGQFYGKQQSFAARDDRFSSRQTVPC